LRNVEPQLEYGAFTYWRPLFNVILQRRVDSDCLNLDTDANTNPEARWD
jgi:hypothetical protein